MWIRVYGCDIQDSPFQVSFLVQDQSFDILSLLQVTCLPDEEVRRGVRSYSGSLPRPRTSGGRQVRGQLIKSYHSPVMQRNHHIKAFIFLLCRAGGARQGAGQSVQGKSPLSTSLSPPLYHILQWETSRNSHELLTLSQVREGQVGTLKSQI